MAYVLVWGFVVKAGQQASFEAAYGPSGDWTKLFRVDAGYIRTELISDSENPGQYLTLDYWASSQAYEEFRVHHAEEYELIDRRCEALTESEELIGKFETIP